MGKVTGYLQKIGKSLMLPVSVLPVCAILMGIGYLLCPGAMQGTEITGVVAKIGYYLVTAGGAIINNMAILFVVGVSLGMSDDQHGAACLAGLVAWLVITTMLHPDVVSKMIPALADTEEETLAFSNIQNPFVGILSGIIGAECYNRNKKVVLPDALAFFSGRRFVSIVTAGVSLVVAAILLLVWPLLFGALVSFGNLIVGMKGGGVGLYVFLNRLLIPSGLHHALNNVFWFDTIGIGDLTKFWAGQTSANVSWNLGMYMACFFPCFMGGVPGAALAMYHTAKDKKRAKSLLLPSALGSIICGITEPFEFSFMFSAFPLYVVYAILCGIVGVITYLTGFSAGFAFSAGGTDLLFSASLPAAQRIWLIIPLLIFAFVLFYVVFRFAIVKFNFKTPGRENTEDDNLNVKNVDIGNNQREKFSGNDQQERPISNDQQKKTIGNGNIENLDSAFSPSLSQAEALIASVGGCNNIENVDCCATRLRFKLYDSSQVSEEMAKRAGAIAARILSTTDAQLIIGPKVQQVCDDLKQTLKKQPNSLSVNNSPTNNSATNNSPANNSPTNNSSDNHPPLNNPPTSNPPMNNPSTNNLPSEKAQPMEFNRIAHYLLVRHGDSIPMMEMQRSFDHTIQDALGIHARPAGKIVAIAKKYTADITITANGKTARAKSITEMLSLGAVQNTVLHISVTGLDANAALRELKNYLLENL